MAGCLEKEFVNILMLGSTNVKISQFVKLFAAYLKYDTLNEVMFYKPNLKITEENVAETTSNIITIGKHNFHFINTPALPKSYKSFKEIWNILSFFQAGCRLNAIILLIEPDKKGDENNFEQYTTHFFSGLKRFSKNILYVVLYNDSCMYDQTYRKLQKVMDIKIHTIVTEKSNVFHLNQDTFYALSDGNWEESVHFCRDLFDYITGVLKSSYVQSVLPLDESLLNLVYKLMLILVEICFWLEQNRICKRLIYIDDYATKVTACYGSNCSEWKSISESISIKAPRICHDKCNCKQCKSCMDVGSCSIFQTPNKTCSICDCSITLHQPYIYQKQYSKETPKNIQHEDSIAISTLTQLFLFVKSYSSTVSIEDFVSEEFREYGSYDIVIKNLKIKFEAELKRNSKLQVTREKLLMSIYKLYEITEVTTIIPRIINENFPEGLRLEVIMDASGSKDNRSKNELELLKVQMKNMKTENDTKYANILGENQNLKSEMNELKLQLNQMLQSMNTNNLSCDKQNFKLQNCNNLNIEGDESANDSNSNDSQNPTKD